MKRGYKRSDRVSDLIQKSLALIIMQEMPDERFRLVTITSVSVSPDLSYAKVYVTLLMDEEDKIKEAMDALNRNAKAFRYSLAQVVKLRIAPELRFVYDESTMHGFKISTLINSAMKKTEPTPTKKSDKK